MNNTFSNTLLLKWNSKMHLQEFKSINHVRNRGKASTMLNTVANRGSDNHIMLKQS